MKNYKVFSKPEMKIVRFENENVISTSILWLFDLLFNGEVKAVELGTDVSAGDLWQQ